MTAFIGPGGAANANPNNTPAESVERRVISLQYHAAK
jgi:hypothetical protein